MKQLILGTLLAAVAAPAAAQETDCQTYIGRTLAPLEFSEVLSSLEGEEPKGAYETSEAYERRLAEASNRANVGPVVLRKRWSSPRPFYNADKGKIPFTADNFGKRDRSFRSLFRAELRGAKRPLGFVIGRETLRESTREATNGFGAKVTVEQTYENLFAIWEKPIDYDESPFKETRRRSYRPIDFEVGPDSARDIIEHGSAAFLFAPTAPFVSEGTNATEATFRRPMETFSKVTVLHGDVHCAFVLDSADTVRLALTVR
ncbi:hypothetical protein [Erythrobacter crassostreae]|uniref:Uncharacterized protein n=1 Tax=Erythrobacter crassostreae TaxID=2828328 RepID=A0A9X1F469_9SPHN|nr:hypothetical protein [Erythrobacter crassostrea]MBV7259008.1 hypothetical protein [Erythrobacter crassostrea]